MSSSSHVFMLGLICKPWIHDSVADRVSRSRSCGSTDVTCRILLQYYELSMTTGPITVAGASGRIGSSAVSQLRGAGATVRAPVRDAAKGEALGVPFVVHMG